MGYQKEIEKLKTKIAYDSDNFKYLSSGEFIEGCGVQQLYHDINNNVLCIMSNNLNTQAFVLYNSDGTLRTYNGDDKFPLILLEDLGNNTSIYYDKETNIKYLINLSSNFGTPMLNSDGTYEILKN